MGSRGVLREASLPPFHTRAELCQFVWEAVHLGLDRHGGVLPVLWHAGQWPARVDGRRQRFHDASRRHPTGSDGEKLSSGERRPRPEENARGARDGKRQDLSLPWVDPL